MTKVVAEPIIDLRKKVAAIYFEEHKSFVRRWIKDNHAHFKKYDCLPSEAERKCIKVTGYTSKQFYDKARKEKDDG